MSNPIFFTYGSHTYYYYGRYSAFTIISILLAFPLHPNGLNVFSQSPPKYESNSPHRTGPVLREDSEALQVWSIASLWNGCRASWLLFEFKLSESVIPSSPNPMGISTATLLNVGDKSWWFLLVEIKHACLIIAWICIRIFYVTSSSFIISTRECIYWALPMI